MSQQSAGTPTEGTTQVAKVPADADPGAIFPRCPWCGSDGPDIFRLRYDFTDGVVAEVLFCGGKKADGSMCRATIDARIVGFERPIAKPVEPPKP